MDKYLAIFRITWENMLVYRLNFFLWRIRTVLQLLLVYFVWWTVFQNQQEIFGYTQSAILTYVMVSALVRAIILSSTSIDVSGHINEGGVVNFLIKPLSFMGYYFIRDLSDKLFNISFVIFEIAILIFLLKPQIIFQTDILTLALFILGIFLGILLYFSIAFCVGLISFWVENSWGPFFLITIFLEGFGGGLFPIDILPKGLANFLMLTPFPYLIYFPSKIYLGSLSTQDLIFGFVSLTFWVFGMWIITVKTLQAGLRHYTAFGH